MSILLALPQHAPVSVEAPVVAPGVPALERARAARRSAQRILELAGTWPAEAVVDLAPAD